MLLKYYEVTESKQVIANFKNMEFRLYRSAVNARILSGLVRE